MSRPQHPFFDRRALSHTAIAAAIAGICDDDWQPVDYTTGGLAEVAETTYKGMRLIVRRTRLTGTQAQLFPDWRHHAFLTDRPGSPSALDADRRAHAVIELAIRDLKAEGLAHIPSGNFQANAAWVVIGALAHNLLAGSRALAWASPVQWSRRRYAPTS